MSNPNIALVVLDTLRKDSFDDHFEWLPGKRFENAWSPSHWTVPVHASMFTGRYPSEVGVYANAETLDFQEPVLAEELKNEGYTTRAVSSNGNISDYFKFDRGFDEFTEDWRAEGWIDEMKFKDRGNVFDWKEYNSETSHEGIIRPIVGTWRCIFGDYDTIPSLRHGFRRKMRGPGSPKLSEDPDDYGSTKALEYIQKSDFGDSEFLFVNLMEAHNPYNPPEEYQTVEPVRIHGLKASVSSPKEDCDHIRQAYEDSVRYLSDMYEKIFEELKKDFDYIITLSDHGELLGEHEKWEHLCGLYPELTHVPLSIYGPEIDDEENEEMVNLIDVNKTVLDMAGITLDRDRRGQSLIRNINGRESLSEYHGLSKLHVKSLDEEWFDKIKHMDTELNALSAPNTYYGYETFEGFEETGEIDASVEWNNPEERLKEMIHQLEKRESTQDGYEDMSDEMMDRLEDLGYV